VIVKAEVKGFIAIVVKGLKIDEFAGLPVVEEFEVFAVVKGREVEVDVLDEEVNELKNEVDVLYQEVDVLEDEVDVLDKETIVVEDKLDVDFEEICFEGIDVAFK